MPRIRNFKQVQEALKPFVPPLRSMRGAYTTERIRKLMEYLGNPQDKLKIVHVAGTSGKTSTCYYIAALLRASGQKVGLTISPHIDQINERVQVNLKPLPERSFCRRFGHFLDLVADSGLEPTYFELLVAFAYWVFAEEQVDYAVIEVGLGGLLDGTNVVRRRDKVCVITDLGLDHIGVLGSTLEKIAAQKAGIITPHNPVLMYRQKASVMTVIREVCAQQHAELHEIIRPDSNEIPKDLPLFQQRNWYLARAVHEYLVLRDKLAHPSSRRLAKAADIHIPARMEIVKYRKKTVIIDGSHNGQKVKALVDSIAQRYPGKKIALLASFSESDNARIKGAFKELTALSKQVVLTTFDGERDAPKQSVSRSKLIEFSANAGFDSVKLIEDPVAAFKTVMQKPAPIIVVTGSFYLLNHIRPLIFKWRIRP